MPLLSDGGVVGSLVGGRRVGRFGGRIRRRRDEVVDDRCRESTSEPAAGSVRMTRPTGTLSLTRSCRVPGCRPASSSALTASSGVEPRRSGMMTRRRGCHGRLGLGGRLRGRLGAQRDPIVDRRPECDLGACLGHGPDDLPGRYVRVEPVLPLARLEAGIDERVDRVIGREAAQVRHDHQGRCGLGGRRRLAPSETT